MSLLFVWSRNHQDSPYRTPQAQINRVVCHRQEINGPEDLHRAAGGPKKARPTKIEIGGREFWISEMEERVPEGTEHHLAFSTETKGYILQFNVESFDKKVTAKLRESISRIEFFDPAKAQGIAGPDSKPYLSAGGGTPCPAHLNNSGIGVVSGSTYHQRYP